MPATGFKVTHNTLDHLLREGLSRKIVAEIALLQNKNFTNRNEFLDALPKPMTLIEQGILLRYASTEQIKIPMILTTKKFQLQDCLQRQKITMHFMKIQHDHNQEWREKLVTV